MEIDNVNRAIEYIIADSDKPKIRNGKLSAAFQKKLKEETEFERRSREILQEKLSVLDEKLNKKKLLQSGKADLEHKLQIDRETKLQTWKKRYSGSR